jgi:cell division protein FtsB
MSMVGLNFLKDGYVKASELERILGGVIEHIASDIADYRKAQNEHIDKLQAENNELRRRVEYLERLSRAPRART